MVLAVHVFSAPIFFDLMIASFALYARFSFRTMGSSGSKVVERLDSWPPVVALYAARRSTCDCKSMPTSASPLCAAAFPAAAEDPRTAMSTNPDDTRWRAALGPVPRFDKWSKAFVDRPDFLQQWHAHYPEEDLLLCWDTMLPDFSQWPLRARVAEILQAEQETNQGCAMVSLAFGCHLLVLYQALALGVSLQRHCHTKKTRILLHTNDVPAVFLEVLDLFWELKEVPYIGCEEVLVRNAPKFKNVFTKLHILNSKILPYDRVLYLDLDTLVVNNTVDGLFEDDLCWAAVPCACPRTPSGAKVYVSALDEGCALEQGATFNGGVLLVRPNFRLFQVLVDHVNQASSPWHVATSYPDSFLLKWIMDWTALHSSFNIVPAMVKGQANTDVWQRLSTSDVIIWHFASAAKPWKWFGGLPAFPDGIESVQYICPFVRSALDQRALAAQKLWFHHVALALLLAFASRGRVAQILACSHPAALFRFGKLNIVKLLIRRLLSFRRAVDPGGRVPGRHAFGDNTVLDGCL